MRLPALLERAAPYLILAALLASSFLAYVAFVCAARGVQASEVLASWKSVLLSASGWERSAARSLPIMLPALGLVLAFKMGFWNIGAEGQLLAGMAAGSGVAIFVAPSLPHPLGLAAALAAAFAAGALWALPPAAMRAFLKANEVLSTLMLNYVAASVLDYLVRGPWRDPKGWGFVKSPPLPPETRLSTAEGAALAALAAAFVYFVLRYTTLGFEIRVVGSSEEAARASGVSYASVALKTVALSGGLAGLGGFLVASALTGVLMESSRMSPGYGYTAIIAAWLAKLNPAAAVATSLFFGALSEVSVVTEAAYRVPASSANVLAGAALLSVLASDAIAKKLKLRRW